MSLFPLLAFLVHPASAVQYNGTPIVTWRVDRPLNDFVGGDVELTKVRVHHCAGGYTDVTVGSSGDPTVHGTFAIPSGNHCALTFVWGSDLEIDGPSYSLVYDAAITFVPLAAELEPKALTPYDVVAGSFSGTPYLVLTIE